MQRFSPLVFSSLLAAIAGCGVASSDSSTTFGSSDSACAGPSCGSAGASAKGSYEITLIPPTISDASGGTSPVGSADETNLCGLVAVGCNPDDEASCVHAIATNTGASGAPIGGATAGSTLSAGLLGAAGSSAVSTTAMGGADYTGTFGSTSAGGTGGSSAPSLDGSALACHVVLDSSTTRSQCEVAGTAGDGEACFGRQDCAAGFACADDGNGVGRCRHYCCGGDTQCLSGNYCAKREVVQQGDGSVRASVSVCLPSVACQFDDPYPCPADKVCSCPSGRVCGVVRADGMTDCVVPGTSIEGQPCPCAAGHVCSSALGTCVRICNLLDTASSSSACPEGACQASASLPANVGVCVSSATLN